MLLLGRRFEEARTRARAILQKDPSNLEALILLGNAVAGLGDLPSAVQITERAIAADPEREGIQVNLGALQLARGNQKEAEEAFTTAVRLNPKSPSCASWRWRISISTSGISTRPRMRSNARSRSLPTTSERIARLPAFYVSTGRPEEAERYVRDIAERTNDPASWSDLADYYTQQRRDADAIRILETTFERSEALAPAPAAASPSSRIRPAGNPRRTPSCRICSSGIRPMPKR